MVESIQVIDDGDSMALLGDLEAIDGFLQSHHLQSLAEPINPHTDRGYLSGMVAQVLGDRAISGKWVRQDGKAPKTLSQYDLHRDQRTGLSAGTVLVKDGGEAQAGQRFLGGVESALSPVLLTSIGALITQYELQQTMQAMVKYLQRIDRHVDDILRAQRDTVLTNMVGANLVIEDALAARNQIGHVSQTTWDKVQATSLAIAQTQAYAIRQIDDITEKMGDGSGAHDPGTDMGNYRDQINEWLAVLAGSLRLQDAGTILELDRVAQVEPDELDQHRRAAKTSREHRVRVISDNADHLLKQVDQTAEKANQEVLLHPQQSPRIVDYCNLIKQDMAEFGQGIGLDRSSDPLISRPWLDAARDTTFRIMETSREGIDTARNIGGQVLGKTLEGASAAWDLSGQVLDRTKGGVDNARDLGDQALNQAKELSGRIADSVSRQSSEILHTVNPKKRITHLFHPDGHNQDPQ
ncbi:hypothetical protein [uncultured Bifidobacterium sp.]|uniref:hypothetical protein n=1 Tax=uncultured Bifidobacterium sp. TaxID=165187 RepID=UPI00261D2EB7|nr:hypothetical protein [uncultured Bifidobacterium sp.]